MNKKQKTPKNLNKQKMSLKTRIIVPPIKSQGIKTKLVPWIKEIVPDCSGRWVEPFLGTGVVAFNASFSKAILNDANPHIINFYKGIQDGSITAPKMKEYLEREGKILSQAGNDGYDHYLEVKRRFNLHFSPYDFIFLSRAGFNGMMRFNKKGHWNIPFCKKPDRFAQAYITKITNQIRNITKIIKGEPNWMFLNKSFSEIIPLATEKDIIYCDPPYFGRYVDYYNGWSEEDEEQLFNLLKNSPANFILSTWHHNDYRENEMIKKYWNQFNILTRDHFYHSGGKIENRRTIVEALVCNFDVSGIERHNHGKIEPKREMQLAIF